jgi:hypothetical protein
MKTTLLVLIAAFALNTKAYAVFPAVGNSASFDYVENAQGTPQSGQILWEITALDKRKATFTLKQTVTPLGGTPDVRTDEMDNSDFDPANFAQIIQMCNMVGGTLEDFVVRAKNTTIKSCKMSQPSQGGKQEIQWLANVPFGMAKTETWNTNSNTLVRSKTMVDLRD